MFHLIDLRHAIRLLRRSPLFTLLTMVVLSGGLGLAIFTFSFLHTAMIKPLPLNEGDRIVSVMQATATTTGAFDAADVAHMRPSITTLSAVGAYTSRTSVLGDVAHPRPIQVTLAEANIFEVTRTPPMLGRGLRREDQLPGAEPAIVLSHATWRSAFGGDASIVGNTTLLDGTRARVVGVMPAGYGFPVASDSWMALPDEVLTAQTRDFASVDLFARLAPGANPTQATSEMTLLLKRARADIPSRDGDPLPPAGVAVQSFAMAQMGEQGPLMFGVLNALAVLILALSCINVTNLLLARTNERARETAVRLALGASRGRLIMQNMWESVLLCLGGGILATALAAWGLATINALAQSHLQGNLAFWWVWHLDRAALLAAATFIVATMTTLGAVVAARASNQQINSVLTDGGARSGGRRQDRLARGLVVTQVATVSLLMFFGILAGIVAQRVARADMGFDTKNLLSANVSLPEARYESREKRSVFYSSMLGELTHAPTIETAFLQTPLGAIDNESGKFTISDGRGAIAAQPKAYVQGVLGSFETIGVHLITGRVPDSRDDERGAPAALLSRALAQKYWPGVSPLGAQIVMAGETAPRTVVGVVSDVLLGNPISRSRSADAIYVPLKQSDATSTTVLFRHRGDVPGAQASFYRALGALDPAIVPPTIMTFEEVLAKMAMMARFVVRLFTFCFGFALMLAVSGTYGLMARSIGGRTREIGVRRALGATDENVVRLLLSQGTRQLGIGALFALPPMVLVAFGFSHFFPIATVLPIAVGLLVVGIVIAVVLLATWIPTRQVLGIPLTAALRRD